MTTLREMALAETIRLLVNQLDLNVAYFERLVGMAKENGEADEDLEMLAKACELQRDLIAGCRGLLARNTA